MKNPTFSLSRPLPSLFITKDFISSLEEYFIKYLIERLNFNEEEAKNSISIEITDSMGTEKLMSINQMSGPRFTDSTSSVEISLNTPFTMSITLKVRLNFTEGRMLSTLAISATMQNAREVVEVILTGLSREIEHHKTWHWIVNPHAAIKFFLFIAFFVNLYYVFSTPADDFISPILAIVNFFFLIYLYALPYLRPYIYFDSKSSQRKEIFWKWFIPCLATFIFSGVILTAIRQSWLGF